jgi:hypothetical protein
MPQRSPGCGLCGIPGHMGMKASKASRGSARASQSRKEQQHLLGCLRVSALALALASSVERFSYRGHAARPGDHGPDKEATAAPVSSRSSQQRSRAFQASLYDAGPERAAAFPSCLTRSGGQATQGAQVGLGARAPLS